MEIPSRQKEDKAEEYFKPFDFDESWLEPRRLGKVTLPEEGLFRIPDFDIPTLDLKYPIGQAPHKAFLDLSKAESLTTFSELTLEPLENPGDLLEQSLASPVETQSDVTSHSNDVDQDVWHDLQNLESLRFAPQLLTWEKFANSDWVSAPALFISEAGPAAFDAALELRSRRSKSLAAAGKLLKADPVLRSIKYLALGRPSVLFPHDAKTNLFCQSIQDGRVSGFSLDCCQGIIEELLDYANTLLQLKLFKEKVYSTEDSPPCVVALANVSDITILTIETALLERIMKAETLLQLQAVIQRSKSLLHTLKDIANEVKNFKSNKEITSTVFDKLQYLEDCGNSTDIVFYIFERVSRPWLETIAQQVGLCEVISHENVAAYDPPRYSKFEAQERNHGKYFLSNESQRTVEDTHKSLRFIQRFQPDHPLAISQHHNVETPQFEWALDLDDLDRISTKATKYYEKLHNIVAEFKSNASPLGRRERCDDIDYKHHEDQIDWVDFKSEGSLKLSIAALSAEPKTISHKTGDDKLQSTILSHLSAPSKLAATPTIPPISTLLQHSLSPLIAAQHRLLTSAALRSVLRDHGLQQHLDLLRAFHLCGSGIFTSNLTRALFSADVGSAERTKGVMRTDVGAMGLRLGSGLRREWPPASSELTLALANILTNSWHEHARSFTGVDQNSSWPELDLTASRKSSDAFGLAQQLPGGLSFAIRSDLPEDEVERLLDPQSLHALDFLRLSYTPHAALADIFTQPVLKQYDAVFRVLLRMLRMQFVTGELYRDARCPTRKKRATRATPAKSSDDHAAALIARFRHRATHLVTTLTAHFAHTGIARPWRAFTAHVSLLDAHVSSHAPPAAASSHTRDTAGAQTRDFSLMSLARAHERALAAVATGLLANARVGRPAAALEDALGDVLRFAALLRDSRRDGDGSAAQGAWRAEVAALYAAFQGNVDKFRHVLREAVEGGAGRAGSRGDADAGGGRDGDRDDGYTALRELLEVL